MARASTGNRLWDLALRRQDPCVLHREGDLSRSRCADLTAHTDAGKTLNAELRNRWWREDVARFKLDATPERRERWGSKVLTPKRSLEELIREDLRREPVRVTSTLRPIRWRDLVDDVSSAESDHCSP